MRDLISFVLSASGHEVVALSSPEAALELASFAAFDVILTDLMFVRMSGFTFAERLRLERGYTGTVVAMSVDDYLIAQAHREGGHFSGAFHKVKDADSIDIALPKYLASLAA